MIIPPIKCQGIKTKLTEWIKNKLPENYNIWYEPFMGSGVVGFNIKPNKAIFCDTNPYIINFYNDIKTGVITSDKMKLFLLSESIKLNKYSNDYYMEVNLHHRRTDLSRAGPVLRRPAPCGQRGPVRLPSGGRRPDQGHEVRRRAPAPGAGPVSGDGGVHPILQRPG